MGIVEKALGKIIKELDALVASGRVAGTGKERSAADDAAWRLIPSDSLASGLPRRLLDAHTL
jgi:hypothetical protein